MCLHKCLNVSLVEANYKVFSHSHMVPERLATMFLGHPWLLRLWASWNGDAHLVGMLDNYITFGTSCMQWFIEY